MSDWSLAVENNGCCLINLGKNIFEVGGGIWIFLRSFPLHPTSQIGESGTGYFSSGGLCRSPLDPSMYAVTEAGPQWEHKKRTKLPPSWQHRPLETGSYLHLYVFVLK
ncbi:hypothetical protein GDO78_015330 [Eleutherodactylus coqui]|uniref:Uncharacterized protein n=1 Tax=Eleutherodactylus coqui TaxID=57060 RepID=A0A8J6EKV9_ELECQ|nr:hypothetical protein GDO78_015330 [Eleutherodactylus coqui]